MSLVKIVNLSKIFDMKSYQVEALKNISLGVKAGEFVGLIGPSGSGKSTLINCLSGLLSPTEGSIVIANTELTQLSDEQKRDFRLHNIGLVFQEHHLIEALTALENVELPLLFSNKKPEERKAIALELLKQLGIADKADNHPSELSGGEQQRVGVARALAFDPPLILADEPTGDLDTKSGQIVIQKFKELAHKSKKGVIMVSHDPRHRVYFDRILQMSDGKLES